MSKRMWLGPALAVLLAVGPLSGCVDHARYRKDFDPRAEKALRQMSDALGRARSFSFHSDTTMDEPANTGQLVQVAREGRVVVNRPNRLFAEGTHGDDAWSVWYAGKDLTLLDKTANKFAVLPASGHIDQMLDDIAKQHGLTLPLADLLFTDPYKVLTEYAETGRYVGQDPVDGFNCHHLLFTQEAMDWQIWIDAAKEPVPRKLVIDYKTVADRPQFNALLRDWNLAASVSNDQFQPVLPPNATKVELSKLLGAEQGE